MENIVDHTAVKEENNQIISDEEISNNFIVDSSLVQIRAGAEEVNRRIQSFIERKRQDVNIVNVREFCCHSKQNIDDGNSCARVDAVFIRRKDSKSHVKVHRVLNTWGPQTVDQSILCKATTNSTNTNDVNYSLVLNDRISASERLLGINKPVPKDVYERLKNIEDRILYLEGISPEYKEFWVTKDGDNFKSNLKSQKRTYSVAELGTKLHELEATEDVNTLKSNFSRKRTYSIAELGTKLLKLEVKFPKKMK